MSFNKKSTSPTPGVIFSNMSALKKNGLRSPGEISSSSSSCGNGDILSWIQDSKP